MQYWQRCGRDIEAWHKIIQVPPTEERTDIWPEMEHVPGFDPNGVSCPTPVRLLLDHLCTFEDSTNLHWLQKHRVDLEEQTQIPLSMSGVAAAAFIDLDFEPEQAEIIYLLLRLPGAAAHALEQEKMGFDNYPFFSDGLNLTNDPGPVKNND